jgi:hypothetical protein
VPADGSPAHRARRGFVIGELLVALLLLAVAVSSLAALMYSVSRRPSGRSETDCTASVAATGKCVPVAPAAAAGGPSKLLRSACETGSVFDQRTCKDTVVSRDSAGETMVKARTDSASLAKLAKREKRATERPDRGFIR